MADGGPTAQTMRFDKAVATACGSFAVTNVDDLFVLATFFAEATAGRSGLTPLKITLGQYFGFTGIIIVSLAGFGVSLVVPAEPIGFLGLVPLLLGIWKLAGAIAPAGGNADEEEPREQPNVRQGKTSRTAGVRSVLKVAAVTMMNGGDNVGTYIPLFSQARGAEIVVYAAMYYLMLGLWCAAAFLAMRQQHVLRLARKYSRVLVPLLYTGIGTYIIVKSQCYPWSVARIDHSVSGHHGATILAVATTVLLLTYLGVVLWVRLRAQLQALVLHARTQRQEEDTELRSLEADGHCRDIC
ncbi:cadmium resistance transporter [Grosmannia clavigera kw1407]|uniref:Cadmium resistance transporter n=1 Tax=Grosmannia clavigera (strain kw1407 / UAMH 11150) TaxID=655863 RepID=F0XII1_GROCL|nr:cadmium resistance transporter [Grosmannia clavigera kw1407]EFX02493.1 cadmium resistance transporter [Grosmannia clavigera kw1407]